MCTPPIEESVQIDCLKNALFMKLKILEDFYLYIGTESFSIMCQTVNFLTQV